MYGLWRCISMGSEAAVGCDVVHQAPHLRAGAQQSMQLYQHTLVSL